MSQIHLPLRSALDHVDQIADKVINTCWPVKFKEFSPPHALLLNDREPKRRFFWAVSVEVMWNFWTSAGKVWACSQNSPPFPIIEPDAMLSPSHKTDFDNGYVNLVSGKIISDNILSGIKSQPRVCSIGESVRISSLEFEKFFLHLESWLEHVVCVPGPDGYRNDTNEPSYLEYLETKQKPKPTSIKEQRQGWIGYVSSFPLSTSPTKGDRRIKYTELGLSQGAGDALHKELSPDHWKKRGPK